MNQAKKFWFKPKKWDKSLITLAIESGFDGIYVEKEMVEKTKALSKVKVISKSKKADLVLGKDVKEVVIKSKQSEKKAVEEKGRIPVIIKNKNWTIIPLENLISKTGNLIQSVKSFKEAKLALETLETGADGILLETQNPSTIKKTASLIMKSQNENLSLKPAKITQVKALGLGDRVIIDTSTILRPGQGMLVGDSSKAMFLVYNENVKSPYCDPRPFRVNAGGAHAYIRMPNDKTKYLGELKTGSKLLVVDPKGNTQQVIAGRIKIEKRPMLLVKGKINNQDISLIMQNAETIRLTQKTGGPISVTKLKKDDEVLGFSQEKGVGRHFGQKIKETILEK
ncbi:MAG: 3-dehydroquinate synthase II [Candidatus Moranbacteria bacterium]|nr:3-dehydroquinate synthase II [Candidatus Moranbacteria bacterium]